MNPVTSVRTPCVSPIAMAALSLVLVELVAIGPAASQPYQSGHQPLELWDEAGRASAPQWVMMWLNVLMAVFALGLLFVWRRVEARWAVGGFIAMIPAMLLLTNVLEVPPLSGLFSLLHIVFWSPALYLLLTRRPFLRERSLYALWSVAITAVILFSFVFDIPDALIYLDHIMGVGLIS